MGGARKANELCSTAQIPRGRVLEFVDGNVYSSM